MIEERRAPKSSPTEILKKETFFIGGESPQRIAWNATNGDQIDMDIEGEGDGDRIFLGAIMGGFFATSQGPRGLSKRKVAELKAIDVAAP